MRARSRATPSSVMRPASAMPTLPSGEYRMQADVLRALLPQTIPAIVERAAREFASIEALVDERARITFPQLAEAAVTSARALIASGIEPGDRVAIWAPNTTEWVHAALGVYAAGGVIVPLNTRFKGNEAAYILDRARAKLLFTVTDFLDTNYVELLRAAEPVASLEQIVVLRGAPAAGTDQLGRLPRARRARRPRRKSRLAPRRSPATRSPTSSSRRAPPGSRRARCSRTAPACRPTTRGRAWSGCVRVTAISSSTRSSTRSG